MVAKPLIIFIIFQKIERSGPRQGARERPRMYWTLLPQETQGYAGSKEGSKEEILNRRKSKFYHLIPTPCIYHIIWFTTNLITCGQ